MSEVQHGPLEERHRQLGASFAEFSGWLMPVSYAGTVGEHTATRTTVGLFDVSHLGKALVRGPGAAEYVNSALTNDLRRIGAGKAQYTLCCTDSGVRNRHQPAGEFRETRAELTMAFLEGAVLDFAHFRLPHGKSP